ncbi:Reverse_transcriptase (RNA-dependent DNA polymerase) [Hexamita inflata]|uniref:Reverse transcriptase (RNA-dependent DNA polymerase) n=1 Tax=Hexamita inflata TaxID=28002 RepID=A0AA86PEK8_9EUKA|nr:Reverse transcriptase (RNA-dependent DNA polymerase) [Hexamita inflata]
MITNPQLSQRIINTHFLKILEFFNQLFNNPAHLQDCKQLFQRSLRPVSCESMILAVFSSCLKTRLMQQVDIHEHRFCFKSGGITHTLARVEQFKVQGKTLTLADCTNAYQAIDYNAIMHALQLQGVNSLFVEYYRAYLNTRSCKYADTLTTGVQAGNSVSSLAFSIYLNYVITAMEAKVTNSPYSQTTFRQASTRTWFSWNSLSFSNRQVSNWRLRSAHLLRMVVKSPFWAKHFRKHQPPHSLSG